MAKRFLPDTDLRELEGEMRQIPGFTPRRSGVIRGKAGLGQAAPYGELVLLFLGEIPPSHLSGRIMNLKNRGEVESFMFQNSRHKKAFRQVCEGNDQGAFQSNYGLAAAVFLLSADLFLWERARESVTKNGIRYQEIKVCGIEPEGYALFCAAKEMCGGNPKLSLSELGDKELISDSLLRLILNGILISRHGIGITAGNETTIEEMAGIERRKRRGTGKTC